MDRKPLIGLAGVVVGVSFSELNDQIVQYALPDIAGDLGIGMDAASWFQTVYLLGLILGAVCGPTLAVIFSARRFLISTIGLTAAASLVTATGGPLPILFASRVLQGLGEGLIISNLIAVALKTLPPAVRLYGLIFYAMTATVIPSLAASLAALWTDVAGSWRLIFIESTPLAALAALLVWYGLPQEPPKLDKLKAYDWPGALLALIGFGAFAIMLEEGERFDWFDSPTISVAALVGAVGVPAFILRELFAPQPLIGLHLLKKRNFTYPVVALILFIIISISASAVPLNFLRQVQGYRPLQSQAATVEVALAQLLLLPATAWLLDHPWADARAVSAVGLLCITAACLGGVLTSSVWQWPQFVPLQALQAIGQPLVIMPLLMIATNTRSAGRGAGQRAPRPGRGDRRRPDLPGRPAARRAAPESHPRQPRPERDLPDTAASPAPRRTGGDRRAERGGAAAGADAEHHRHLRAAGRPHPRAARSSAPAARAHPAAAPRARRLVRV